MTGHAEEARILEADLHRLQADGLGLGIKRVVWAPGAHKNVQGEVIDGVLLVYAKTLPEARDVVAHEVVHHEIARASEPYLDVINTMMKMINAEAYRRQELLTNAITARMHAGA